MRRVSAVFVLALSLLAADNRPAATPLSDSQPDGPAPTFRSDVALARVDAQVVDRDNRPIQGLRIEDFILRAGGKQQEISNFQSEQFPVDVILLLDVSRSMEPHVQRIASASHEALSALGDQDRIAVMVFDRSTRVRMPFRVSREDAEREFARVVDEETFEGGTDITRGLLDAADYMAQNARHEARRAIVILTDDQTERDRNEAAVLRALTRTDAVLSALIAPGRPAYGIRSRSWFDGDQLRQLFGDMIPQEFGSLGMVGPHTQSAGSASIANRSGGDSISVDNAAAFRLLSQRSGRIPALPYPPLRYLQSGSLQNRRSKHPSSARCLTEDVKAYYNMTSRTSQKAKCLCLEPSGSLSAAAKM